MSKTVTMYNNKGGVSKTTTAFNLGVYTAKVLGKKVLFVDCDPQCNLTELFLASTDLLDDVDANLPGTSIYQALKPRFEGAASRADVDKIEVLESSEYPGLFLLRGDLEFSMAETPLSSAISQSVTESIHDKHNYVAIHNLFSDLVRKHGFEQLVVDVGPSTGALTRMAFLSCDAFLVPVTPDRFCLQAVNVLGTVIGDWITKHERTIDTFGPFGVEAFLGRPKFVGAVSQNFKVYGGRAKKSYARWEERIANTLTDTFINSPNIDSAISGDDPSPYVAQIQDVATLAPIAQMFGRAIFDIDQDHTREAAPSGQKYSGAVWGDWETRMDAYKDQIASIASAVTNA